MTVARIKFKLGFKACLLVFSLSACTISDPVVQPLPRYPIVVPDPPPAIEKINQKAEQIAQGIWQTGEKIVDQVTNPPRPERPQERPTIQIISDPPVLLDLGSFVAPASVLFEVQHKNKNASATLVSYQWKVFKLGIPGLEAEQLKHQSTETRLNYLFDTSGVYRVSVSVTSSQGDVVSDSVRIWARS